MSVPTQAAEVVEVRALRHDVRELVLRPVERQVTFQAGQWISVHLPLGGDKPTVRAYTLAEPPTADGRMVLCFDRVKGGAASAFLFEVRVGDRLVVSDPLGSFTMPQADGRGVAMVTWLTGVVPMRCMLLDLARGSDRPPPRTLLLYGGPSADAMPYHQALLEMARAHPWFCYVPVVPPSEATPQEGMQRVLETMPTAFDQAFGGEAGPQTVHPMLAGVRALVLPAREWLVTHLGYAQAQVQKELYD
ncbi:MAG: hypothetical protein EB084_03620 [Proteobacteria bacterium]|nr:hypothetical protein [Pseudomonadota bacterium]